MDFGGPLWGLFVAIVATFISSQAHATQPLRDPKKLWNAKQEWALRLGNAHVVMADYALIRKDFPQVADLTDAQIDQWLVDNAAFISEPQAAQEVANTAIPVTGEKRQVYRPQEYRRAYVIPMDKGGLIDSKGNGAIDPDTGGHSNGLATLGEMIREYTYEKLVKMIFDADGGRFDTVGSYAVLDFGFNVKHADGSQSRAGSILRQAHVRYHSGPIGNRTRDQSVMLPRKLQLLVELTLRRYGITSAVRFNGKDLVNIQGDTLGAVVDFGSFLDVPEFTVPMAWFYDKDGNGGSGSGETIAQPGDAGFIQPNPNIRVPFDIWGYTRSGKADPKQDNPFIYAHELAASWAAGTAGSQDVQQHLKNMLDPVRTILSSAPAPCADLLGDSGAEIMRSLKKLRPAKKKAG